MTTDTKKLMWLASFPKSGNTWMRAFLANYLLDHPGDGPLPLAELSKITRGDSSQKAIEKVAGRGIEEMSPEEIFHARHQYLETVAAHETPTFIKTHNANVHVLGVPLIPKSLTRCMIYIVRNPLDMVLSYADHMNQTLEKAVASLARDANRIGTNERNDKQIMQHLGSWSMHVRSWVGADGLSGTVLRYEDMLDDPEKSFTQVIEMIGAPLRRDKLQSAIEATQFKSLSKLEKEEGFHERVDGQEKFFRKGTKGQWKDELPGEVVDQIISDHREVMTFLKYI